MYAEQMRKCKTCFVEKGIKEFYFNKTKNSYFSECKVCNKKRSTVWNKSNRERYISNCKKHKENNQELYRAYKTKEYYKNIDSYKIYSESYRKSNHGRNTRLHLSRMRELSKINATPKWLSKAQVEEIKNFYLQRPDGYHVDHIVPLKGKNVSGLHVPWNLQYLPALENIKKRNKF